MWLLNLFKKKETNIIKIPKNLQNIESLLNYVKVHKKLPIKISKDILNSLIIIANTPEWYKQLDQETINNLNKIYDKWQTHINTKQDKAALKVGKAEGFERPKIWEGTWEEYKQACENNEIDENTKVYVYEDDKDYHGTYIEIDENGEMEEYMK